MPRSRPEPAAPLARRLRRPSRLLVAALIALLAGCGTTTTPTPSPTTAPPSVRPSAPPTPAGSQDAAAVYRTIEDQIIAIRGLQPKTPVVPTLIDRAGIQKVTTDDFTKSNPPDVIAANERILKAFGLLPADSSLRDLYVELLGSAVAGLYSPDTKKLYVVSTTGTIGPVERSTFSHEFTHALQDQNFDIGSLDLDEVGQGDRSFARLSLVEGDATLAMTYWTIQNLSAAELQELIAASANDPSTQLVASMPPILRESLFFPYTTGLAFVQGLQTAGGWPAVDAAFEKPPASTEQIMHPEKYAAGEGPLPADLPADLATRLGAGWKVAYQDQFGEFQLGIWLRQNTALSAADANAAAAGWGGDRVAVVEGPGGAWGVILRTVWDTDADAAAFEAAASPTIAKLADPGALLPGAGGRERWVLIARDPTILQTIGSALGLAG
jgi:hypothetical protein